MDALFEFKQYLKYAWNATGAHGVHSPAVFDLITQVLSPSKNHYCFYEIEAIRHKLLANKSTIEVTDYGAGSRSHKKQQRKIKQIAHYSLQSTKCAQSLFKIVCAQKPNTILELGTSLGITTAYLASAHKQSKVISIEGDKQIAALAKGHLQLLNITNATILNGTFDDLLQTAIELLGKVDFALIDGNHRYKPTMNYFETILPHLHHLSTVIMDDIHWSPEMQKAWKEITSHPQVRVSIDFFHFGLLWFDPMFKKQQYTLRLP